MHSFKLLILVSLVLTSSLSAETISHVYFANVDANAQIDVLKTVPLLVSLSERKILAVRVFLAPRVQAPMRVNFEVNKQVTAQTLPFYTPEEMKDFQSLSVAIPGLNLREIKSLNLKFIDSAAVSLIALDYEETAHDPAGDNHLEQIKRLEKLSEYNLYEENNRASKDKEIRRQAAVDLLQYPSTRALKILFERVDYDGVRDDYDLKRQALHSFKQMIPAFTSLFGELSIMETLTYLYNRYHDWNVRDTMLEAMYDFQTSAALFFSINNHVYSGTAERRVSNISILEEIYKKSDFLQYVEYFKDRILNETFGEFADNQEWAQEVACDVLAKAPQNGLLKKIFPLFKNESWSFQVHCENALIASLVNYDLKEEILSDVDLDYVFSVIGQTYKRGDSVFDSGYTHDHSERIISAYILLEIKTAEAVMLLKKISKEPELEDDIRKAILENLR